MIELAVTARDTKTKPAALRAQGLVPAVFYGPKEESTPIQLNAAIFTKVWEGAGETTIVNLTGVGAKKDVLIHSVDTHPVTGAVEHVDFYVIEAGKALHVSVPLEFIGEAPAEKKGGIVVKTMHEIEIEVAPSELPQHLDVDLSMLAEIGDHITVADIVLPPSAKLATHAEDTVVSVTEAKEEAIPAEAPEGPVVEEASAEEAAEPEAAQ